MSYEKFTLRKMRELSELPIKDIVTRTGLTYEPHTELGDWSKCS